MPFDLTLLPSLIALAIAVLVVSWAIPFAAKRIAGMVDDKRELSRSARPGSYGPLNREMICPYCQNKGTVRTKRVSRKTGIGGHKATAALLTRGLSLFATGLSRKEMATRARCDSCQNVWEF